MAVQVLLVLLLLFRIFLLLLNFIFLFFLFLPKKTINNSLNTSRLSFALRNPGGVWSAAVAAEGFEQRSGRLQH